MVSDAPRENHDGDVTDDAEGSLALEDSVTDAPAQDPDDTGDEPTGETPLWRRRAWLILPWVLVVLIAAAAVFATLQLLDYRAQEAAQGDVERTAGSFMLTLTTWDATEGMGTTREELREAGTDRFAGEVDELFGTTEDLAGLAEIGARSEGEVRRMFVQEIDDGTATALVVVVQSLSSDASESETNVRYAEVELLERDGRWLVDDVELLIDVSDRQAGVGVSPDVQEDPAPDDPTDEADVEDAEEDE